MHDGIMKIFCWVQSLALMINVIAQSARIGLVRHILVRLDFLHSFDFYF